MRTEKGGVGKWENRVLPLHRGVTHRVNQAKPLHLNSNLEGEQVGLVSEDKLTMTDWLLVISVLHSEAS